MYASPNTSVKVIRWKIIGRVGHIARMSEIRVFTHNIDMKNESSEVTEGTSGCTGDNTHFLWTV